MKFKLCLDRNASIFGYLFYPSGRLTGKNRSTFVPCVFAAPPPSEDTLLGNGGLFFLWSVLRLPAPWQDGELLNVSIPKVNQPSRQVSTKVVAEQFGCRRILTCDSEAMSMRRFFSGGCKLPSALKGFYAALATQQ
jgi:hypothetical protein